jgi:hypothetical protein
MTRTYSVKYKSKSKMLTSQAAIDETTKTILEDPKVKSVKIEDQGQIVTIDAEEDDFCTVMNTIVNVFRKIDDKSEVSYQFQLNHR